MATNFVQDGVILKMLESGLVHPTHTDGLVDSGDPVVQGVIVGVSLKDGLASTDEVSVDTHGVWDLSVVANDGGDVAVVIGDQLWIDGATAVINKNSAKTKYGVALKAITSGATATIPVRINA